MRFVPQFSAENRFEPCLSCDIENANRSIEAVAICEGERVMTLPAAGITEGLQRRHAIHG